MHFRMTAPVDGPSAPAQGTCYGFGIHSTVPLACLRDGAGPALEIVIAAQHVPAQVVPLVTEWRETPDAEPYARLYRAEAGYWLWLDRAGWTQIETRGPRITVSGSGDSVATEERLWTIPTAVCLLHRGDLVLHAAAVEVDGHAILFAAPGGAGKSTLAAAFVQAGYRLLSEDVTCVKMAGEPSVIPGPAMLRLRPDVLSYISLPAARAIRTIPSRVTFALDPAVRGGCDPVPLRAIFVLDAGSNGLLGRRISPAEGIRHLWPTAFRLPADDWTARCFAQLGDVATAVPIRQYARPHRLEELPRAVEELAG